MLQAPEADVYALATGQTHSVQDVWEIAVGRLGLDNGDRVRQDPGRHRSIDTGPLAGKPTKTAAKLGQGPRTSIKEMIKDMDDADMALATQVGIQGQ